MPPEHLLAAAGLPDPPPELDSERSADPQGFVSEPGSHFHIASTDHVDVGSCAENPAGLAVGSAAKVCQIYERSFRIFAVVPDRYPLLRQLWAGLLSRDDLTEQQLAADLWH